MPILRRRQSLLWEQECKRCLFVSTSHVALYGADFRYSGIKLHHHQQYSWPPVPAALHTFTWPPSRNPYPLYVWSATLSIQIWDTCWSRSWCNDSFLSLQTSLGRRYVIFFSSAQAYKSTPLAPEYDACARDGQGNLKDATDIEWYNDTDDVAPMKTAGPLNSTGNESYNSAIYCSHNSAQGMDSVKEIRRDLKQSSQLSRSLRMVPVVNQHLRSGADVIKVRRRSLTMA